MAFVTLQMDSALAILNSPEVHVINVPLVISTILRALLILNLVQTSAVEMVHAKSMADVHATPITLAQTALHLISALQIHV